MTIYVLPRWHRTGQPSFDVTSGSGQWRALSPFTLGPVMLYDGRWSRNMENGWQYAKVYSDHLHDYWEWAESGWRNSRAVRYPMGKGVRPLYSLWAGDELGYIDARKRIYMPLYSQAVRFYAARDIEKLRQAAKEGDIFIKDYDAYDHHSFGYSWNDVINDPDRKMGHGFVLAMMLEGFI
jgi:hypothetical protein